MLEKVKLLKNSVIQPKSILLIFFVVSAIVISSAIVELNESKKEMFELMEKQSHSLLETLLASSANALLSYEKIESGLKERLLNNAVLIKYFYEKGIVNDRFLEDLAAQNKIFRINIFSRQGRKIYSSNKEIHAGIPEKTDPLKYLEPIFNNEKDTLIIGIKPARFIEGFRFAVAIAAKNREAIVLNIDAEELLNFRKQVGFGVLLKEIAKSRGIEYVLLQDNESIIAAAGDENNYEFLDSVQISQINKKEISRRITEKNGKKYFEALHPFVYNNEQIGIFRLGLSLEPVDNITGRITNRIIIMSVLLIAFGVISVAFIFIRQNFNLLTKRYKSFQEYSDKIIENIGEAIILLDSGLKIKSANKAAVEIFALDENKITGRQFGEAFECLGELGGIMQNCNTWETQCSLMNKNKTFLISKSGFKDEEKEDNIILVIKDLTEIKELEKQNERQARLAAMGELASSVAHEIRNPLNAISTIVQQLNKDFHPEEGKEEYNTLTGLVYNEVNRINSTIESFLRFARPLELIKERFSVSGLMEQIKNQYAGILKEKDITLEIKEHWNGDATWDRSRILQIMINLIENSIDAIKEKGKIEIELKEKDSGSVVLLVADTGKGMDEKIIDKIFNLYFTTKQKGNGIGLSIVQKIVEGHNGQIDVKSRPGKGTVFSISLPKNI